MDTNEKKQFAQEQDFDVVMNSEDDRHVFDVIDEDGECIHTSATETAAWDFAYRKALSALTVGGGSENFGMDP